MKIVLDRPVCADALPHRRGTDCQAAEVVGRFGGGLLAADGTISLHFHDAAELLPVVRAGDAVDVGDYSDGTNFMAAVALVLDAAYVDRVLRNARGLRVQEGGFDFLAEDWVIVLERQRVVGSRIDDGLRDLLLTTHRVDGDGRAAHVDLLEKLRNGSDLVRLLLCHDLPQRETTLSDPGAHHVQWARAGATIEGAAHGLSVNRDNLSFQVCHEVGRDLRQALPEHLRVECLENTAERVRGRHAARQLEKLAEPRLARISEVLHVFPTGCAVDHRQQRDDQDVDQLVAASTLDARIGQDGEDRDQAACRGHAPQSHDHDKPGKLDALALGSPPRTWG